MQKVTVYKFKFFDRASLSWHTADDMATESAIKAMGAVAIAGSAVEMDAARVGAAGLVIRDLKDRKP